MTRVIALDPGGTTGWAEALIAENRQLRKVTVGQEKWSVVDLWHFLEGRDPSHLVMEDFEYRNRSRAGLVLVSRDMLGVGELWTGLKERPYYVQTAAQGKGHFTDTKLKDLMLYTPGNPHGRDALRHLLQFLCFKAGTQLWDTAVVPFNVLVRYKDNGLS